MFPAESVHAQTSVLANAIQARSAVLAREDCAVIRVGETVPALVALGAVADVRAVRVLTGGAVAAR